jgi:hypothetical protein
MGGKEELKLKRSVDRNIRRKILYKELNIYVVLIVDSHVCIIKLLNFFKPKIVTIGIATYLLKGSYILKGIPSEF